MKHLILLAPLILLLGCGEGSAHEEVFLCKCIEEPNTGNKPATKEVYVFLIKGGQEADCCTASVLENYPGHHEIWKSEAPDRPDTWQLSDDQLMEITAKTAQENGCAMQQKSIEKYDVDEFNKIVKDYYPLLPER